MAQNLLDMNINPGDPVTSDLLSNIITNIQKINTGASASVVGVNIGNSTTTPEKTYTTGASVPYYATKDVTKIKSKTVTMSGFASPPVVSLTLKVKSAAEQLTKKYQPVLIDVTATSFTFRCIPYGASANGPVEINWIAVGDPATS
jgi:hypothetical protein